VMGVRRLGAARRRGTSGSIGVEQSLPHAVSPETQSRSSSEGA